MAQTTRTHEDQSNKNLMPPKVKSLLFNTKKEPLDFTEYNNTSWTNEFGSCVNSTIK